VLSEDILFYSGNGTTGDKNGARLRVVFIELVGIMGFHYISALLRILRLV
jgi:hypothetical protein